MEPLVGACIASAAAPPKGLPAHFSQIQPTDAMGGSLLAQFAVTVVGDCRPRKGAKGEAWPLPP